MPNQWINMPAKQYWRDYEIEYCWETFGWLAKKAYWLIREWLAKIGVQRASFQRLNQLSQDDPELLAIADIQKLHWFSLAWVLWPTETLHQIKQLSALSTEMLAHADRFRTENYDNSRLLRELELIKETDELCFTEVERIFVNALRNVSIWWDKIYKDNRIIKKYLCLLVNLKNTFPALDDADLKSQFENLLDYLHELIELKTKWQLDYSNPKIQRRLYNKLVSNGPDWILHNKKISELIW